MATACGNRARRGADGGPLEFHDAMNPCIMKPDLQSKLAAPQAQSFQRNPHTGAGDAAEHMLAAQGADVRQREEFLKNAASTLSERPSSAVNEFSWSYSFWTHIYESALMNPHVSERDTVILCLPGFLVLEIGLDYSFMISSYTSNTVIAVDASGSSAAFLHKNGRISQYEKMKSDPHDRENSRVEGIIVDPRGNEKYFKMWHRGISFSSKFCPLCYLVDQGGVRTTTDVFSDLNYFNSAVYVLFHEQKRGPHCRKACFEMVNRFSMIEKPEFREWKIGPLRICLSSDISELRVMREDASPNRVEIRLSPVTSKAALSTSKVRITASEDHIFVRRGTRHQSRYHSCQMHSDIYNKFEVRASGHAAGFNEDGKFTIF